VALLRAQGKTYKEIAELTRFSETSIPAILANPKIAEMVESEKIKSDLGKDELIPLREQLDRASRKAIQLLEQVVEDSDTLGEQCPSIRDRLTAASEILSMTVGKAVKVNHTHATLRPEDFKEIQRRAMEALPEAEVIDVPACVVDGG
jgi:hypothetical protein